MITIYECPSECSISPMPGQCMWCKAVLVETEYHPHSELAAAQARIRRLETIAHEAEKQLRIASDMAYTPKTHVEFLNAANMLLSALQEK